MVRSQRYVTPLLFFLFPFKRDGEIVVWLVNRPSIAGGDYIKHGIAPSLSLRPFYISACPKK